MASIVGMSITDGVNTYYINKDLVIPVLEQIKDTWGNLPEPVIGLCKVALLKNLCIKNNITRAIVNNNKIALISELSNVEHLQLLFKKQKVNNFKVYEKQGLATIEIIFTKYNYEQK